MKKYFWLCALVLSVSHLYAQKEYLAKINPATGAYSTVDSITGVQWIAAQASAYNETGHQTIFNGVDNTSASRLYSVNANGALAAQPIIVMSNAADNLTELRYDNSSNILYGLNWISAQGKEYLVSINTSAGTYTNIAAINGVQWITGGASAIDAANHHFIFIGQDNTHTSSLYTIDETNGNVVSSPALSASASSVVELRYDNASNTLYGIYMSTADSKEHIASIDVATGALTDIGALNGVQYVNIGTAALDRVKHRYMFIGQDASYATHLYSVNTSSGSIVSSPVLADSLAGLTDLHFDASDSTLYGLLWGSGTPTGVDEPVVAPGTFRINGYPNPTSSQATLQLNKMYSNVSVTITNSLGTVVRTDAFQNASEVTINRGDLPAGAYFLTVMANKVPFGVMKLVVID